MAFFEWEGGVVQKGIFQKVTTPLSNSIEPYLPTQYVFINEKIILIV